MDGGNYEYDLSSKNKAIDQGLIYNNDKYTLLSFVYLKKKKRTKLWH